MINKKEFIALVAERNNTTKVEATKIVEAFLDGLEAACEQGTGVNFVGLMKAEIVDIPERHGVTKLGGEEKEWTTPAHKEVKLKAGKTLKNCVK